MASAAILLPLSPLHSPRGPDLTPTDITFGDARLNTGREIHFDSGIRNLGNQGTPAFNVKWSVNEQDVGAYGSHSGVPEGATVPNGNSQFDWTFTKPGIYTVTFNVDVDDHVKEVNEGNNSRSLKIKVADIAGVLPHGYTEDGTVFLAERLLGQNS
ncbi:CARDB domain-containing protein [Streptomyces viridochromogenes]|uniref:CARDB domain-containing protein n=1 Tax=Streptomyces viridochromogenes TaxID=1938 RepID=UPI00131EB4FD|nr:CARDB domain-containing protein [Streptomyces viridochromogenes]